METKLIHGDCLEVLAGMPNKSCHCCLTDPPYNVGLPYDGYTDCRNDYRDWCAAWFGELTRMVSGSILLTPGIANMDMWYTIRKPDWVLSWIKSGSSGRCRVGFNNWEPVLLYGKPTKVHTDVIVASCKITNDLKGKHPAIKPVELFIQLLDRYTTEGQTVIDPFTGSGTTGVACKQTNRNFIGIEQSEQYLQVAMNRVNAI